MLSSTSLLLFQRRLKSELFTPNKLNELPIFELLRDLVLLRLNVTISKLCSSSFSSALLSCMLENITWYDNNITSRQLKINNDCVKRPSSSLCRLRRFKIVYFTLHYITLHYREVIGQKNFCCAVDSRTVGTLRNNVDDDDITSIPVSRVTLRSSGSERDSDSCHVLSDT